MVVSQCQCHHFGNGQNISKLHHSFWEKLHQSSTSMSSNKNMISDYFHKILTMSFFFVMSKISLLLMYYSCMSGIHHLFNFGEHASFPSGE